MISLSHNSNNIIFNNIKPIARLILNVEIHSHLLSNLLTGNVSHFNWETISEASEQELRE